MDPLELPLHPVGSPGPLPDVPHAVADVTLSVAIGVAVVALYLAILQRTTDGGRTTGAAERSATGRRARSDDDRGNDA